MRSARPAPCACRGKMVFYDLHTRLAIDLLGLGRAVDYVGRAPIRRLKRRAISYGYVADPSSHQGLNAIT